MHHRQTDRHTTTANTAFTIASSGKNQFSQWRQCDAAGYLPSRAALLACDRHQYCLVTCVNNLPKWTTNAITVHHRTTLVFELCLLKMLWESTTWSMWCFLCRLRSTDMHQCYSHDTIKPVVLYKKYQFGIYSQFTPPDRRSRWVESASADMWIG